MLAEADFARLVLADLGLEPGRCEHADGSEVLDCNGRTDTRKCPTCGAVWQERCDGGD